MIPKSEAEALVEDHYSNIMSCISDVSRWDNAKKCALITVKHVKSVLHGLHKPEYCAFDAIGERKFTFEGEYPDHMTGYDMLEYLEQVEQEIQKL